MVDKCCAERYPSRDDGNVEFNLRTLKAIDFELAYLAMLTREGLKPLSRWEKPLDEDGLESLHRIGLLTARVRRKVKTGDEVVETIFSRSQACIGLYEQRFENTPIDKSAETQQFEGFLFGYPSCCIERYIRSPYSENDLSENDRKILFHWVCDNCTATPLLLKAYKRIYHQLCEIE